MSELKQEFENWAISHGGLSLVPAKFGECDNGWIPATYAHSLTEIAWRAFANRRTQPPEAVADKLDAQPIGEVVRISDFDGTATIGLYDHVVRFGDLVYAVPQTGEDGALKIAVEALQKVSAWSFGWDGDCGVRNVADDALAAIDAARQSKESADQSREAGK